ncbi:hypothetical protein LEP1GSC145_4187 [Leptospira interrogans serovar Djasiman str. LT1649]|uniref:Uncharacterized protein n=2 Tax=Leptospira interrogans TaxID=173 RepID=M6GKM5_LEPIR|nr:hypothetical protein LEP1GSC009_2103 [Leptospira interrogans serovar Grippotyphosa str. Andaman]EMF44564.1 hypothetical protein LEP1GSC067_3675 [Leptospira interrogans serovar Lora str. TE 1992]EMJ48339.1 hypothetical protein LEP1GSC111_0320 [Leptospira interrogans str. UT126]EMM83907.1 hypothetical protein LEP1GSC037_4596 [Leptospira interrogans str. 2006001854]EMM90866.1 hypothetical protein LEP1GSC145_4187 [Leptospira interrogans serovar Djasiman str. LT1649]EMN09097.1 hypothetical prote
MYPDTKYFTSFDIVKEIIFKVILLLISVFLYRTVSAFT